ncbi:MAG: sigma-54 dependent transcriptional regulator [Desulfocapsaceae bacterium]|nr:sigma-54 dependent transcriptional regulator [Desulfocapsaceae bacterium]
MGAVLIVDDMEDLRYSLAHVIKKEGYSVLTASTGEEAADIMRSNIVDLIFLDIGLPDGNGIQLIGSLKNIAADVDIVMLTGTNDAKSAVISMREGAVDYIVKPFEIVEFKAILHRIMQSRIIAKKALLDHQDKGLDTIICSSRAMLAVKEKILSASEVHAPVLITGETGTGKELVARAIHDVQQPKGGIFVKVDCGTLAANLIESELFGYEKGAFTDARADKKGLVEIADGGTLFLDEIGNLPVSLQSKLLRLIEDSVFRRVGGLTDIAINVRIIAATNSNLDREIRQGNFRGDLYYRLNIIPIALPPLRDRENDILLLADYFLHRFAREFKRTIHGFTAAASAALLKHAWPGNIRELRNMVEREVIFCKSGWISLSGLHQDAVFTGGAENRLDLPLKEIEKRYISKVLKAVNNNKSQAAKILGISRTTLREKLQIDQFPIS